MRYLELGTDASALLVGMLLDKPDRFQDITLTHDMIFGVDLKDAFKSIVSLNARNMTADSMGVLDDMVLQGLNVNFAWLADLELKASRSSLMGKVKPLESDIRRAHSCKVANEVIGSLTEAVGRADVEAIQGCVGPLMNMNVERKCYDFSFSEMFADTLADAAEGLDGAKDRGKISTGIADIDSQIGGFHNGDLIILAARPAMGKTACMINMALGAGEGKKVGIMSGEQPKVQIGYRMFSTTSGVEIGNIRKGMDEREYESMAAASEMLQNNGGRIYEKPAPTITDICNKAREWKHKYDIDGLYIDYLQRIKSVNTNAPRHEQVGEIAMTLKELARTLDIPIIALAQVNRSVESRPEKRPGTGDIKDSGTIEQEADQILTIYRDEVYFDDTQDKGLAEIDVKKNRHGATGVIRLEWIARCLKFKGIQENWSPFHQIPDQDKDEPQDDWRDTDHLWGGR